LAVGQKEEAKEGDRHHIDKGVALFHVEAEVDFLLEDFGLFFEKLIGVEFVFKLVV